MRSKPLSLQKQTILPRYPHECVELVRRRAAFTHQFESSRPRIHFGIGDRLIQPRLTRDDQHESFFEAAGADSRLHRSR